MTVLDLQGSKVMTDGKGLWSRYITSVHLMSAELNYINDERDFGELIVHFDTSTWNVREHGLIYTDDTWQAGFKELLTKEKGFSKEAADDVSYSEQGMHGTNYVSLDVGKKFLDEWFAENLFVECETCCGVGEHFTHDRDGYVILTACNNCRD